LRSFKILFINPVIGVLGELGMLAAIFGIKVYPKCEMSLADGSGKAVYIYDTLPLCKLRQYKTTA